MFAFDPVRNINNPIPKKMSKLILLNDKVINLQMSRDNYRDAYKALNRKHFELLAENYRLYKKLAKIRKMFSRLVDKYRMYKRRTTRLEAWKRGEWQLLKKQLLKLKKG